MAFLNNASILYESGQIQQTLAAMADSGDHKTFGLTAKPWSSAAGFEYTISPYGLATGGAMTVGTGNDNVQTAALTAYLPGATGANASTGLLSVAADTSITVTRGATTNSGTITPVAGTASTAFSETRGAAGGPPFIPVGSIEIGQVRTTSVTAAAVLATEIYQVVGSHQERYDYPVWSENPIAGTITFAAALPVIHTDSVAKKVYARVATPLFAEIPRAKDWVPAETTNSVSSEQYYDGAVGSVSSSLGQASFTVSLNDGVTDALLAKKGQNLLFKFLPDKNKSAHQITQGILAVARTFAAGTNPTASVTVSPAIASADFSA